MRGNREGWYSDEGGGEEGEGEEWYYLGPPRASLVRAKKKGDDVVVEAFTLPNHEGVCPSCIVPNFPQAKSLGEMARGVVAVVGEEVLFQPQEDPGELQGKWISVHYDDSPPVTEVQRLYIGGTPANVYFQIGGGGTGPYFGVTGHLTALYIKEDDKVAHRKAAAASVKAAASMSEAVGRLFAIFGRTV